MLFIIPWVLLMVAAVVAVPIAAKMSPARNRPADASAHGEDQVAENADVEDVAIADDFAAEPADAEPLGDDAFAEFG